MDKSIFMFISTFFLDSFEVSTFINDLCHSVYSICRTFGQLIGWGTLCWIHFRHFRIYIVFSMLIIFIPFFKVCNGATYVNVDMLESRKDGSRMLLIEGLYYRLSSLVFRPCSLMWSAYVQSLCFVFWSYDCIVAADNGGGMDPDKMRHCMSLGYSAKSKVANTIGQCKLLLFWMNVSLKLLHLVLWSILIYILIYQMAMDLRQAPWDLEQMSLCFHVVMEKMEKGLSSICF